jgi:hypothetical protein
VTVSVYLPVALSVLVAAVGRQGATRLAPTSGTVIALVAAAVLCAAGTTSLAFYRLIHWLWLG